MIEGLFAPNDSARAVARALYVVSISDTINLVELDRGLGIDGTDELAVWELRPLSDAIAAMRTAWSRVSESTRRRLVDGRLRRRIAAATGFVDGVEA